jgi:hypothetical protein
MKQQQFKVYDYNSLIYDKIHFVSALQILGTLTKCSICTLMEIIYKFPKSQRLLLLRNLNTSCHMCFKIRKQQCPNIKTNCLRSFTSVATLLFWVNRLVHMSSESCETHCYNLTRDTAPLGQAVLTAILSLSLCHCHPTVVPHSLSS